MLIRVTPILSITTAHPAAEVELVLLPPPPSPPFRAFCPCAMHPAGRQCRRERHGRTRQRSHRYRASRSRDNGGGDGDGDGGGGGDPPRPTCAPDRNAFAEWLKTNPGPDLQEWIARYDGYWNIPWDDGDAAVAAWQVARKARLARLP